MGDVYDALNRGRDAGPPGAGRDRAARETGGLPLEQVEDAARLRPGKAWHSTEPINLQLALSDPLSPASARRAIEGSAPAVIAHRDRTSPLTEQYRQIRTQLLARDRQGRCRVHLMTSPGTGEGKTTTCVNLGVVAAELQDTRTLLIEADLRRPAFDRLFDRPMVVGLTHVLRGDIEDEREAIYPTVYANLHVLPAGGRDAEHAGQLLAGRAMERLLDRVRDHYDLVLIDSPPVMELSDAAMVGAWCDAVILVVQMNRTPRDAARQAKRQLEAAGCTFAGSILTHADPKRLPRYMHPRENST